MICLKNRTFAVSQTTNSYCLCCSISLWFAWKIVLLQYRKQRAKLATAMSLVVICLKNRTFAVSQTTRHFGFSFCAALWFAWKIVLLQYRKQHTNGCRQFDIRCDLLEKSYFCSIANNITPCAIGAIAVVICLKNRTFAVSQTTSLLAITSWARLWFAWKIVLLQYRKQLCRHV